MKKILSIILLISFLVLTSGAVLAQADQAQDQGKPETTTQQQACIKAAQEKRDAAIKTAKEALDSASKDAFETKQSVIKEATGAFNLATKAALKVKQDALALAEKSTDPSVRAQKIKEANDAYNNNKTVKEARVEQTEAIRVANEVYDKDEATIKAKPAYAVAVKAANDQFQIDEKVCIEKTKGNKNGFFKRIGDGISGFFSKIWGFLTRNKK